MSASAVAPASERLVDLEHVFSRMRTAIAVRAAGRPAEAGIVRFPAAVVTRRAWAAEVSHEPGLFPVGRTWVAYRVRVGADDGVRNGWSVEAEGRFCIVVGDDGTVDVPSAEWRFRDSDGDDIDPIDVPWRYQLPRSVLVPRLSGPRLQRSINRLLYDGESARSDLIATQRGLVHKVVAQYRRHLEAEACALDVEDLEQVGLQRILELAERRYAGAAEDRPQTAAWSKVAMREVGNAVKAEIAAVTGISVEFRQLLTWFRMHPHDRNRLTADVAADMAFAAGVTRLVQAHRAVDRIAGAALLEAMLADGRASYIGPGDDQAAKAAARAAGQFVVAPRSSLAEIERAQRHSDQPPLTLDGRAGSESDTTMADLVLVDNDRGFAHVDVDLFLERLFADAGLTQLEADVWSARTGVHGVADELPEIAADLGLDGRAEARAALRRAWRKLSSVGDELRRAVA